MGQSHHRAKVVVRMIQKLGARREFRILVSNLISCLAIFVELKHRAKALDLRRVTGRLFIRMRSLFRTSNWKQVRDFIGSTGTVLTISIICLMATTALASRALFLSLNDPTLNTATASDFFTSLQQNILLFFSQYVLLVPYLRGMRLDNQQFWFLTSLIVSTLTAITSISAFRWTLPVSTFLSFISNAAQVISTLLLIQEDSPQRPTTPVSPLH